jgi:hypothetical protein
MDTTKRIIPKDKSRRFGTGLLVTLLCLASFGACTSNEQTNDAHQRS